MPIKFLVLGGGVGFRGRVGFFFWKRGGGVSILFLWSRGFSDSWLLSFQVPSGSL